MTQRLRTLFLVLVVGCGGSSTRSPTGSDGGPCYANGTCNGSLECVASTCTAPPDGGVVGALTDGAVVSPDAGPSSSCVGTDTDTGTFSFDVHNLNTQVIRFDIDGVGNQDTVAGCGIIDTIEGYDNAFKAMTVAGNTMGIPNYSVSITGGLGANNPQRLTMTVSLTGLDDSVFTGGSDECVRVAIGRSTPSMTYPTVTGSVMVENGRVRGKLDGPLFLHFPDFNDPTGTARDLEIRDPVLDLLVFSNFTVLNTSSSVIGGYVFFRPLPAEAAAYSGFYSFDADLRRLYPSTLAYPGMIGTNMPQYQDIYMAPDGTRQPCSAAHAPNAMSITMRF